MPELTISVVTLQPPVGDNVAVSELPQDPANISGSVDFRDIFSSLLESLMPAENPSVQLPGEALPQVDLAQVAEQPAQLAADSAALIAFSPVNLTPALPLKSAEIVETKPDLANPLQARLSSGLDAGLAVATAVEGEQRQAANFAAAGISLPAAADEKLVAIETQTLAENDDLAATSSDRRPVADTPASFQAALEPAMRPAAAAAAQPRVVTSVEPHLNRSEWNDAFSQKVVWMANQQHQTADIKINPPNLGPVEVRLSINQDQASLMFISPHAAVRDAIQLALPRLNEMLANNGLSLGNVFVGSEAAQQQAYGERGEQAARGRQQLTTDEAAIGRVQNGIVLISNRHLGMVDLFA